MKFEEAINYMNKELMYHIVVISEGSGRGNTSTKDVYDSMIYLRKNLSKIKECASILKILIINLSLKNILNIK